MGRGAERGGSLRSFEAGARCLGGGSDQAVGDDGDGSHGETGYKTPPDIGGGKGGIDLLPQVAGADKRGDDQH